MASIELDVEIASLNSSGDGVARGGREAIAVPFTLPGERVRVRLPPPRSRGAPATLLAVLRPSPHRVVPRCRHFGPGPGERLCGGCGWQHIAYAEQLRLKSELVTRLVREQVRNAPAARTTLPGTPLSDPWGYRQKAHFVFGPGGVMGHYVRNSRRVIDVHECPVHDSRGNDIAFRLKDAMHGAAPHRSNRPGGSSRSNRPLVKSVAVRAACHSPEIGATLVLASEADRAVRSATRQVIEGDGAPTSFHVNIHPRDNGFIFGRETRRIAGPERIREDVAGTAFLISPTAFFQTNVRAAEILVRLVLEGVPAGVPVLDLYAGAGLFALPLARAGHAVVAVEENRAAVADGEASARLNRIPPERCRFVARRVEAAVGPRSRLTAPAVVLDPPREGCAPAVIDAVFGGIRPRVAVYVSCNPEALARDLRIATEYRYRIESMQPVDMFPHTAHVETVAVLAAL